MIEKKKNSCLIGPGKFQWNAGAWFGSAIGGSAFMLLIAGFLFSHGQSRLALIPAIAFALISVISMAFWSNRHRIYPFSAIMVLLGLIATIIPIVLFSVDALARPAALAAMNWPTSLPLKVIACLVVPCTIWKLSILEREIVQQKPNAKSVC